MEGLIPFIYRAIVQYKKEGQVSLGDLFFDEPSSSPTSYFRLPGDSGRYPQVSASDLFSQTTASGSGAARRSPVAVGCPSHRRRTPPGPVGS
ncbi:hypothetical protein U9M48_044219 [Paspalum notatum var. saurae]|uniref:Uncharacterized protein n=1 Tax=Paspalum notatum var. saurae TaxID=547442 RepID=A0AAQ3UYP3_PASNO